MSYQSKLSVLETEIAIKYIKDLFENEFAKKLHLVRVSAPLFVKKESGLNDNLNGVEEPITFAVPNISKNIEIVHSLAKWKREALAHYDIAKYRGIYTDMNAIRKDETLDRLHSLYVDQWDYELKINKSDRNEKFLYKTVEEIYDVMKLVEKKVNHKYPCFSAKLPAKIHFISTNELEQRYPKLDRKERENVVAREYKAVFLYQIGWDLKDGKPHDGRAPDYDDWSLNGDIIVYNPVLDIAFELSSMGIRVDEDSIVTQINHRKRPEMLETPYVKAVIDKKLPYTLGGGIGQSRLCMFYLEKAHIGEVQASLWSEKEINEAKKEGIFLL